MIGVGHAARGLAENETVPRLGELANALASWAATYQELPVNSHAAKGKLAPQEAIAQVKFTEACLQRYTLGASPAYLAAVDHARGVIPRRGGTLRRPADNF